MYGDEFIGRNYFLLRRTKKRMKANYEKRSKQMKIQIELGVEVSNNGNFVTKMTVIDKTKNSKKVYWESDNIDNAISVLLQTISDEAFRLQSKCDESYDAINKPKQEVTKKSLHECFNVIARELDVTGITLHAKDDITPEEIKHEEHVSAVVEYANLLDSPIDAKLFPYRARTLFLYIKTYRQLCNHTKADLARMYDNIGYKTADGIQKELEILGLSLKGEE